MDLTLRESPKLALREIPFLRELPPSVRYKGVNLDCVLDES